MFKDVNDLNNLKVDGCGRIGLMVENVAGCLDVLIFFVNLIMIMEYGKMNRVKIKTLL